MSRRSMGFAYLSALVGALALSAGRADAQGPPARRKAQDTIPAAYRPPAGMCRIWLDGVSPAQQPAPTDCPKAVQNKPANGRVLYGEDASKLPAKTPTKMSRPTSGSRQRPTKSRFHEITVSGHNRRTNGSRTR